MTPKDQIALIDLARGVASPSEKTRLEALMKQDVRAKEFFLMIQTIGKDAEVARENVVEPMWISRAAALMPILPKQEGWLGIGKITFDSFATPALGVRSGLAKARELIIQLGDFSLDLRIEAVGSDLEIVGTLDGPPDASGEFELVITSAEGAQSQVFVQLGMDFEARIPKTGVLQVRLVNLVTSEEWMVGVY